MKTEFRRPRQPIRQIELPDGETYPSQLDSWLYWRNHLTSKPGAPYWDRLTKYLEIPISRYSKDDAVAALHKSLGTTNDGVCPQCNGKARFHNTEEGIDSVCWCLCEIMEWQQKQIKRNRRWRSTYSGRPWNTFNPVRGGKNDPHLSAMLVQAQAFAAYPDQWLIMSGPYRIGKTHLLETIATNFGPICLFLSVADLQQKIFTAVSEDNLSFLLQEVSTAPILVLDDLGAEHSADFIQSTLLSIIGYRYRMAAEYPMAITTNLTNQELELSWGRIGARLTDPNVIFVEAPKSLHPYGGTNG
jgi:DNA replication protein DnaC